MKKYIFFFSSVIIILCAYIIITPIKDDKLKYNIFSTIPVMNDGRIKPIDTFARNYLIGISGKETLEDLQATAWLVELLFNQNFAYKRLIFNITNQDVSNALQLPLRQNHLYSFEELSSVFNANIQLIQTVHQIKESDRSLAQNQLAELYVKYLIYLDISNSLSALLPQLIITNNELANDLNITQNEKFSYFDISQKQEKLTEKLQLLQGKKVIDMADEEKSLLFLVANMRSILQSNRSQTTRVIPSQDKQALWETPWEAIHNKESIEIKNLLSLWKQLANNYNDQNQIEWNKTSLLLQQKSLSISSEKVNLKMYTETLYNKLNIFEVTKIIYCIGFILAILSVFILKKSEEARKIIFSLLLSGVALHLIGLLVRCYIMSRPPVATLYESIIFVSFIGCAFSLFIEKKRMDYSGIFLCALIGVPLQYIGSKYAIDGDTMGMLSAVLNTNFWLATHVLTISIGYGCCLIAGGLGHFYLLQILLNSEDTRKLNNIFQNMLAVGLFALFFSLSGTILGGIWADQSWGRFWGWDPKENGALLIVLWLLLLLHGLIGKLLSPILFAAGMALTNIVVILTWFGVNLLGVGLHSYGFAKNTGVNITIFCTIDILYITICLLTYLYLPKNQRKF